MERDQWNERFAELWRRLGAQTTPTVDLVALYGEPSRSYHGVEHLVDCLQTLDEVRSEAERPNEVELALWYHDAIYDSRRIDNERKSAGLAVDHATAAGLPTEVVDRVHALVLATEHQTLPSTQDECLIVDIDLKILAAEPGAFDRYEAAVREEYDWVPLAEYRAARRDVLRALLDRESIYQTRAFRTLEPRARENLARSLRSLDG